MMDAPGQHFAVAQAGAEIAGALWLVEEGDYPLNLAAQSGRAFVGRVEIWWRSRWQRTAARRSRRR